MNLHTILIFLHVMGALGMFAAWAIEGVALGQLKQTSTSETAGAALALRRKSVPLGPIGMLTALGTGIWMMASNWGYQPWIAVAVGALVGIILIGIGTERRVKPRLAAAVAADPGHDVAGVHAAAASLAASLRLRLAAGIGIISLMTMKPGLAGSLTFIAVAFLIGLGMNLRSRS